jgi:hypothetical protein
MRVVFGLGLRDVIGDSFEGINIFDFVVLDLIW